MERKICSCPFDVDGVEMHCAGVWTFSRAMVSLYAQVSMHRIPKYVSFQLSHYFPTQSVKNSPESESAVLQLKHFNNRVIKSALNPLSSRSRSRQHSVPFCWRSENGLREQLNVISTAYTIDKDDKYHATVFKPGHCDIDLICTNK